MSQLIQRSLHTGMPLDSLLKMKRKGHKPPFLDFLLKALKFVLAAQLDMPDVYPNPTHI